MTIATTDPTHQTTSQRLIRYLDEHPKDGKYTIIELGKILGCTRENIRQAKVRYKLQPYIRGQSDRVHYCQTCGLQLEGKNKCYRKFCSPQCMRKFKTIELTCHICGVKFLKKLYAYNRDVKKKKVPFWCCSRKCWGSYVGNNYGVVKHPENIPQRKYDYDSMARLDKEGLSPREASQQLNIPLPQTYAIRSILKLPKRTTRKHDYDKIFKLRSNGYNANQISRTLNIPYQTIYNILRRYGK